MPNTINTNLQNNVISQSALEQFTSILAPLQAFSTSFNDEASQKGKTINITTLSNTTSAADFAGTYASQNTTYGTTTITLSGHKFVTWHVTDTESSQSSAVELQRFGYQKGGDLAKAVYEDILSAVTDANYGTAGFVGAASVFDADDVADLRGSAIAQNLPIDQCALVLDSTYFTSLLKDNNLNPAMTYGDSDVIRDGRIPSLFGLGYLYESTALPGNAENLVGFLAHPSAMAVAMRYLAPINSKEYISARRLYDETSGMVLGYREFYDARTGTQTAVLEAVYGYSVALGGSIIRMTSI
tara:strand:+ start:3146 stop:4042 length:897 start_codon:yes stop_codon:yes gene_type:complete